MTRTGTSSRGSFGPVAGSSWSTWGTGRRRRSSSRVGPPPERTREAGAPPGVAVGGVGAGSVATGQPEGQTSGRRAGWAEWNRHPGSFASTRVCAVTETAGDRKGLSQKAIRGLPRGSEVLARHTRWAVVRSWDLAPRGPLPSSRRLKRAGLSAPLVEGPESHDTRSVVGGPNQCHSVALRSRLLKIADTRVQRGTVNRPLHTPSARLVPVVNLRRGSTLPMPTWRSAVRHPIDQVKRPWRASPTRERRDSLTLLRVLR